MPTASIKAFDGLKPIVDPVILDGSAAQVANNTKLVSGAIQPLRDVTTLKALTKANPETIFRYGSSSNESEYWLEFLARTDVMRSPIVDNQFGMLYWADGTAVRYAPNSLILSGSSFPGASYRLGIPAPTQTPTITADAVSSKLVVTAVQVTSIVTAGKMKVTVTTSTGQTENTFTTVNGSDLSIAASLSTMVGVSAVAVLGAIEISFASNITDYVIQVKSGETSSYDAAVVTYTNHLVVGSVLNATSGNYISAVVDGTLIRGVGDSIADAGSAGPASVAFYPSFISQMQPGEKWAIEVNGNPAVAVTIPAGTNTFPPAVSAQSLSNALGSVAGTTVEVRTLTDNVTGQPGNGVVLWTTTFGNATTLRARKINPSTVETFSTLTTLSARKTISPESRTVVFTYVSAYGEEGPPSPASAVVAMNPTGPAVYSNLGSAPSGDYNITLKRIYRSSTVGSAAQFQFVAEIPVAQSTYTDSKTQDELGEVLPSNDWVAPPSNLRGLKMMANNVAIGFVENTVYLSEPNLPHAWPHKVPVDHKIVGLGTFGQTVVVLTTAYPYMITAVDPAAASSEKISLPQACVSIDSVVDTGNAVLYASPDGLVQIGSGGIDVVTRDLFTKEQWQTYNPSSIRATVHENRYVAFYTKLDGTRGMLIFDFSGQGAKLVTSDLNSSTPVTAYYHDPRTDTLYLARGGNIVRYDSGSALTYTWRSKTFRLPFPFNMTSGQVIASSYPVTMKIYADGVLRQTKTVTDQGVFRLISGFRSLDWSFELIGTSQITQAAISTSVEELQAT